MRDNTEVYCQWLHTAVHSIDDNIDVLRIIDSKETKKRLSLEMNGSRIPQPSVDPLSSCKHNNHAFPIRQQWVHHRRII